MRILCPVDRVEEVDLLVDAGAGELYAGAVPPFWEEEFGPLVTPTRRTFAAAHAGSVEDLGRIARAAALRDVPLFAVLNAAPVPDRMVPPLVDHVEELARLGVRGVIVADPGLLGALAARRFRRLDLVASTLLSAFNGVSVSFLARLGATRVVLPRELSAAEIAAAAGAARVPVEAVAMRGRCPNVEGFCTHLHDDPGRTWPCELRYGKGWRGPGGGIPPFVERALSRDEGTDRHYSCGLCAVPLLAKGGVHALKVVGRGAETERKASAVSAVAAMIDWGEGRDPSPHECARKGKELFRALHGRPCRRENCYFPEFGPEGGEG